jgi:hypothetical protein
VKDLVEKAKESKSKDGSSGGSTDLDLEASLEWADLAVGGGIGVGGSLISDALDW